MKKAIVIILVFIVCSCKGQTDSSFSNFVNKFEKIKIPFTMPENYNRDIYKKNISNKYVDAFICKDKNKCKCLEKDFYYYSDGYRKFMYSYGIKIPFSNKDYVALIYYKTYQDGKTAEDYELTEYILTVFDNMRNIISSEVIGRMNEIFWCDVFFNANNKINVTQNEILVRESDFNNSKIKSKVIYKEYSIDSLSGIIQRVDNNNKFEFRNLTWDDDKGKYIIVK